MASFKEIKITVEHHSLQQQLSEGSSCSEAEPFVSPGEQEFGLELGEEFCRDHQLGDSFRFDGECRMLQLELGECVGFHHARFADEFKEFVGSG